MSLIIIFVIWGTQKKIIVTNNIQVLEVKRMKEDTPPITKHQHINNKKQSKNPTIKIIIY